MKGRAMYDVRLLLVPIMGLALMKCFAKHIVDVRLRFVLIMGLTP